MFIIDDVDARGEYQIMGSGVQQIASWNRLRAVSFFSSVQSRACAFSRVLFDGLRKKRDCL